MIDYERASSSYVHVVVGTILGKDDVENIFARYKSRI